MILRERRADHRSLKIFGTRKISYGLGGGVGRILGVGATRGVGVGRTVAVGVGLTGGVNVAVGVGVGVNPGPQNTSVEFVGLVGA